MSNHLTLPVSERDHVHGADHAPVTLVEYGDFQCPYCGAAFPIVEALRKQQGERMRFVFRHFPLSEAHENAENAAEAAEAAATRNRFWEMHRTLFTHQQSLSPSHLAAYAERLGLDAAWFRQALAEHTFAKRVREDFLSGVKSGVNGTPTFYLNGLRYDGPLDLASLTEAVADADPG